MELTDILPIEKWVEFEKEIHDKTGLSANVFNTSGVRISDYHEWVNRLCPAVKATSAGQSSICAVAHMNLATEAMKTKEPVIQECDAGLIKMVVPIFVNNTFLGAMGACGLILEDGEVDTFLVNKITGIDEDEVISFSEGIASITNEKIDSIKDYIIQKLDDIIRNFINGK